MSYDAAQAMRAISAGNQAYRKGDFAGAVAAYEEALRAGVDSADLWFNLGHAHYRAGAPGPAALAWERALRRKPSDEAARESLALVRSQASAAAPPFATRLAARIDPDGAALALLIAWLCFWLLCLLRWRAAPGWGRRLAGVGAALALVAVGGAGAATGAAWQLRQAGWSVVLEEARVYEGPEAGAAEAFPLPPAHLVRAKERRGERVYIETPGGLSGWMETSKLEAIDADF